MLLFFYFLCQELTSIGELLAGESFGRTLRHFTNKTGQRTTGRQDRFHGSLFAKNHCAYSPAQVTEITL